MRGYVLIAFALLLASCKPESDVSSVLDIKKHEDFSSTVSTPPASDSRSTWQKPEFVINKLGDLTGKKVVDIGAGTGYFSYRMAFGGATVIAVEVDTAMVSLMESFKENLPTEIAARIEPRLVSPTDPMLTPAEGDAAIIINTIAYISDKAAYLAKLKAGLKSGSMVAIVDYKNQDLTIPAPPMEERVSIGLLQEVLRTAGYTNIIVDTSSLKYQYIITAIVS